jgi:hypothetical protein
MLAYVMDGDHQGATKALRALIAEKSEGLHLTATTGLDECDLRPGDETIRQTRHELPERFLLHHLLLAVES